MSECRIMGDPRVCVIILNWNGLNDTLECLESLRAISYCNYKVIVVDNGSEGNEAGVLSRRYGDYVSVIRNDENRGFAEGNNIAIRYALKHFDPAYFLLLNNDTIVDPEFLGIMVDEAQSDPSVGIMGSKVYFCADRNRLQFAGGKIHRWTGGTEMTGCGKIDHGQFDNTRESDWVLGCSLLAKRAVTERIGLLYEGYFSYFEEADWCVRCREAGLRVVWTPRARIWHKGARSVNKVSGFQIRYMTRNRFFFVKRNSTWTQYLVFVVWFFLALCPLTTVSLLFKSRDIRAIRTFYGAVCEGLRMSPGERRPKKAGC